MKTKVLASLLAGAAFLATSCEKHSWKETKALFHAHGEHAEHGAESHGHGATEEHSHGAAEHADHKDAAPAAHAPEHKEEVKH